MGWLRGWTLTCAAVGVAICLIEPAAAQQRAGGDGHALDANLRSGSGGRNTAEGQIDYRRRNNIITGNVSGGRAFRDQVDYFAPNEFQDQLGSDDLFRFRAESLESTRTRGRPFGPRVGGGESVYRSFSAPPNVGSAPRSTQLVPRTAGAYDPGAVSQGAAPLAPQDFQLGPVPGDGGQAASDPGQPGGFVELSELLGVRAKTPQPDTARDPLEPGDAALPDLAPATPDADEPGDGQGGGDEPSTSRFDYRLRPELPDQREARTTRRALLEQEGVASALLNQQPTTFLGRQLQSQLQARQQQPRTLDQRVARMEQSLYNQLQQRQAAEADRPYQNVLEAMKSQRDVTRDQAADREEDDQRREEQFALEGFELPSDQEVAEAEDQRREALRRTFGDERRDRFGDGEQADGEQPQPEDGLQQPGQEDQLGRGEQAEDETATLDQTLQQLDYEAAPLESLVGDRNTRADKLLAEAEQQIAKGQFFDAERTYRQLLVDAPERPMVRVGLIHAQLGAAMIRSAALNMRKLFNEHPELIATRYDRGLLPSQSRLQWLQKELQRMIQQNESAVQPGLMLAYLGYQIDSRQLIRYGLATAESESPRDPLLPVLRRIWLDQPPAGGLPQAGNQPGEAGARQSPATQPR
jgi:hypothetical protein